MKIELTNTAKRATLVSRDMKGATELGQKIRALRKQAGWNLEELSRRSGVALGTLSKLENGKAGSNVKTHQKLCEAFGMSLADLYRGLPALGGGETAPLSPTSEDVETFTYDGKATAILLARQVMDKHMLPQLLILEPGGQTHLEQNRVGCEKWLCVLEGALDVQVGEQRYRLSRYGTLYFKASRSHQLSNPGKTTAKCISVTSPVGL